jgi:hypothetical protein
MGPSVRGKAVKFSGEHPPHLENRFVAVNRAADWHADGFSGEHASEVTSFGAHPIA